MKIGLGIGIPFIRNYVSSIVFDPSKLFTGSTNGVWYDPSDTTTLYRDAAGTQPVTAVEQPVGLMLDKSKGLVLGPELVTNGDFSNGATGWTVHKGVVNFTGGVATFVPGVDTAMRQSIAISTGKRYQVYFDLTDPGNFGVRVIFSGTATPTVQDFVGSGAKSALLPNDAANVRIEFDNLSNNFSGTIDNISVRELPGNHAFNSSGNSANFPVLSARYNLLTKTEDFSDAVWTKQAGTTVSSTKVAAPDGTLTAFSVTGNGTSGVYQGISGSVSIGQSTRSVYLRSPSGAVSVGIKDPAQTQGAATCNLTTSWQRFTLTETTTPTGGFVAGIWIFNIPVAGIEIAWPDIRSTNDALNQPAYQRVNIATDYDTVGFKPYLRFNGTNQWLQTNSIDFTYGDKMFVSAGVRKLKDGALGMLFEFSTSVNATIGTFSHILPDTTSAGSLGLDLHGNGSSGIQRISTGSSPATFVSSTVFDLAGTTFDTERPTKRINGVAGNVLSSAGATDTGGGNYGNYPLYIGARAGSSLWFNGRLYQMVVAGKQASAAEITSTETYLNQKTGAF